MLIVSDVSGLQVVSPLAVQELDLLITGKDEAVDSIQVPTEPTGLLEVEDRFYVVRVVLDLHDSILCVSGGRKSEVREESSNRRIPTDLFEPQFADYDIVNTAIDVSPRVHLVMALEFEVHEAVRFDFNGLSPELESGLD